MKTILINPPWFCLQNRVTSFVPLGLASIAAVLVNEGHDVTILNGEKIAAPHSLIDSVRVPAFFFHDTQRYHRLLDITHPLWTSIGDAIVRHAPAVVGVTMWSGAFISAANVCRVAKDRVPGVITVVGGVHPTLDPRSVVELPEVDFVISGEGETAATKLWRSIGIESNTHKNTFEIPGVWTRLDGCMHEGGKTELIGDLDLLPSPNYEVVEGERSGRMGGIITARGCPFHCAFCASEAMWTKRVRFRSIEKVIEELAEYRKKYDPPYFRINDDSFCLRKKRVIDFCDQLRDRFGKDKWSFWADANVNSLDEEIVTHLEGAGCTSLAFGIESVAPRIREEFIRKKINLDHAKKMIAFINKTSIESSVYFMTGFPDETESELEATIDFMRETEPGNNQWSIVTPYPGTELHRYALKNGILPDARPEHLTHHSVRTSMANIETRRYERILNEILEIAERIKTKHRLIKKIRWLKSHARHPIRTADYR